MYLFMKLLGVLRDGLVCLFKKKKAPKSEEYLSCAAELHEQLRLLKLSLNMGEEEESPTGSQETMQVLENTKSVVR